MYVEIIKTGDSNPLDKNHIVGSCYTPAVGKKINFFPKFRGGKFHPNSIPCPVLQNGGEEKAQSPT